MRKNQIVFSAIGLALLGAVLFQSKTNTRLRRELAAAREENSQLRQDRLAGQETRDSLRPERTETSRGTAGPDAAQLSNEAEGARVKELESEVLRLRGEVSRAARAETEVAQMRAELEGKRTVTSADGVETIAATNTVIRYLGEPVPPPANLDFAYTKEGLLSGIQEAARNAGVTLKKVEIETSEFPFLAGVVCEQEADFEKLKEQFKQMNVYQYNGSVSSHTSYAFNLVPYRAYPPGSADQINRRTMLRQQMFYQQLTGTHN